MLQAGVLRRLLTGGTAGQLAQQQRTCAVLLRPARPFLVPARGASGHRNRSSITSCSSSGDIGSSNSDSASQDSVAPSTVHNQAAASSPQQHAPLQHTGDPQQQQLSGPLPSPRMPLQHSDVSLEVKYSGYLTLYNRRIRFSAPAAAADGTGHAHPPESDHVLDFDIIGHPQSDFAFAVTFPFHPYKDGRKGGEVTVIREYAQGPNQLMYCLPTGGFDRRKHADLEACAKAELSEEALLAGGRWVPLLPPEHPGLSEVKWCMNRFRPYLCIDPVIDAAPGSRDAEEVSMEVLRVPLEEFREMMVGGDMLLPSIATGYMALDWLRDKGLL